MELLPGSQGKKGGGQFSVISFECFYFCEGGGDTKKHTYLGGGGGVALGGGGWYL